MQNQAFLPTGEKPPAKKVREQNVQMLGAVAKG